MGRTQWISSVQIIGTGLIGTSIGLALCAAGADVRLRDRDPAVARRAEVLGAGRVTDAQAPAQVCVLAVPPEAVPAELRAAQELGLATVYTDVASVKERPQLAAEALGCDVSTFVGGHPLAGREQSGPDAARADLFTGRPWVLTPTPHTSPAALEVVRELVAMVGAIAVEMRANEHDDAVALVSHVPQLMASLTAARLLEAPDRAVSLSGQGVRDVTRIAASDPSLWTEIVLGNAEPVTSALRRVADDLGRLIAGLESARASSDAAGRAAVREVLVAGNRGYDRIPGKHGTPPVHYVPVPVVVSDQPGQLARLLTHAGEAGMNVEDVSIEHSPGQPVGLVRLFVRPEVALPFAAALRERGWTVQL